MRDDIAYLLDIYQATKDALNFSETMNYAEFIADSKTRRAIINCLHEIGEASKKLSKEFKLQHRLIQWNDLATHRNELAHEYFRTDLGQVWHVVKDILPGLIEYIEPLLPKEGEI